MDEVFRGIHADACHRDLAALAVGSEGFVLQRLAVPVVYAVHADDAAVRGVDDAARGVPVLVKFVDPAVYKYIRHSFSPSMTSMFT